MAATHREHVALLLFTVHGLEQCQVAGKPPRGHREDAVVAAQGDVHHGVPGLIGQKGRQEGHITST